LKTRKEKQEIKKKDWGLIREKEVHSNAQKGRNYEDKYQVQAKLTGLV